MLPRRRRRGKEIRDKLRIASIEPSAASVLSRPQATGTIPRSLFTDYRRIGHKLAAIVFGLVGPCRAPSFPPGMRRPWSNAVEGAAREAEQYRANYVAEGGSCCPAGALATGASL